MSNREQNLWFAVMEKCEAIHDQIKLATNEADGQSMLLFDDENPFVLNPKNFEEIKEIKFKLGRAEGAQWALSEILSLLNDWDLTGSK